MDSSMPVAEPPSSQVMDVVPPPASDDHLATPPAEEITATTEPEKAAPTTKQANQTKQSAPVAKPGSGVTAAIFATVVIVIALSAMATFAYIKTK